MHGFSAISEAPISTLLDTQVTVTETQVVRFASKSFVTRETDAPAHEHIPGRITKGLTLGRRLNSAEDGQFGALLEASFGEIELANADGELDNLVNDYYTDGQRIVLKIGATEITNLGRERVQPYNNFATVYISIAGEWSFEHDVVRLRISGYHSTQRSDKRTASRLQDRLQPITYSGTGGENGSTDLTGRTVPTAFGRCLNVPAQLVEFGFLTYQLHGGTMDSITAVYDAAIPLAFDADYASYAALIGAAVPAGSYSSCLAIGFIRLGTVPFGEVTADIRGSNSGGDYADEHGGVIRKILTSYAGLSETDLDGPSFDALDVAQPNSMGLFLPAGDQSTIEEVIERIAFSCGAFAGQDRSGLYRVKRLEVPTANQHWSFTDRDIIAIERLELPYGVPWKSWGVGYQINWTIQTGADVAAGATQSRRQFLESEYRFAYVTDSAIAQAHLTSSGAPLRRSLFLADTAALDEATRLLSFYGLGRAMYRIVVKTVLFSVEIGQTIRLTYDRWDLDNGKNFVVVNIEDDADNVTTTLVVFG